MRAWRDEGTHVATTYPERELPCCETDITGAAVREDEIFAIGIEPLRLLRPTILVFAAAAYTAAVVHRLVDETC